MYFVCIFQIADDIFRMADAEEDTRQKKKKLKPGEENILAEETPSNSETLVEEPPDIETLMAWEAEGGCEAACPHGCWVEPDGVCPHGNSSWLPVLGFI